MWLLILHYQAFLSATACVFITISDCRATGGWGSINPQQQITGWMRRSIDPLHRELTHSAATGGVNAAGDTWDQWRCSRVKATRGDGAVMEVGNMEKRQMGPIHHQ
ncbi:hypothetical protein PBY51_002411 [Eleginops maclovinus]|uniref:Secreted protein n=1 Tax=Eleginops maclovinus TaxID=56733 RepID=A0AAN7X8B3_ELEMC|nr:hypothetical protein PBY51_002411 [Eleginops maclovinus]